MAPWTPKWIDGAFWTLPIELGFYALVYCLLLFKAYREIGVVVAAVGVASSTISLLDLSSHHSIAGEAILNLAADPTRQFLLLRYGVFFAVGVLLWMAVFVRLSRVLWIIYGYCMVGAIAEIKWHSEDIINRALKLAPGLDVSSLHWFVPVAVWMVAVSLIALCAQFNDKLLGFLSDAAKKRVRVIGLMTYPLYLVHQNLGYVLIDRTHGWLTIPGSMLLSLCSAFAVSFVIVKYLEPALQTIVRRALGMRAHGLPEPQTTLP